MERIVEIREVDIAAANEAFYEIEFHHDVPISAYVKTVLIQAFAAHRAAFETVTFPRAQPMSPKEFSSWVKKRHAIENRKGKI